MFKFLVKTGVYVVGLVIIGAGVFVHKTKPKDDSINTYLKNEINSGSNTVDSAIVSTITSKDVDDYVFWKIATVKCVGKNKRYFGIVHNWIPME